MCNMISLQLENQLDIISDGKLEWKEFLNDFWQDFSLTKDDALKLSITEVVETLDKELQEIFFQPDLMGKLIEIVQNVATVIFRLNYLNTTIYWM